MKIRTVKNIFDETADAVCVTTNGIVKANGEAVMGAGIAKEANLRYNLAKSLGEMLRNKGNHCYVMGVFDNKNIVTFPTKNRWKEDSSIDLIRQSCNELNQLADEYGWQTVLIPPVGCGCGRLEFNTVKTMLEQLLDNRFILCVR